MAEAATELRPWELLRDCLDREDRAGAELILSSLRPEETVRVLFRLSSDDQQRLLALIPPENAAELLYEFPDKHAADLIDNLGTEQAAHIVDEMPSDEGADLLGSLDRAHAEAILLEMDPEAAGDVRELIDYPADAAGGLMGLEQFAYPQWIRTRDFIRDVRERREEIEKLPSRLLLIDRKGRLTGAVRIEDVLLADPDQPLGSAARDVISMPVTATLDELDEYFFEHETFGVPIVTADGRLVGRVRHTSVQEALAERASSDQLKVQGIVSGEEIRAMPLTTRSRRRLSWLSVNILLNIVAASVIAMFQDTLAAVIALAVFLPIVSDMSGCSGNQAVAVSMRELTLGIVQPRDFLRVWWQEVSVGLINGAALGSLLALAAWLWQGNAVLGLVVGLALAINTVVAVSIGGTVPLLLKRFNVDPAVASGPVLTTVTDMCGFFLVLGFATVALPYLT
ncbi:MAG: magnesium transporter [Woeseiaceae bacterium]|jgi:magnesium transporter|nr:magnesium transporter [Woeseiaceae bacterium]